jgi:hypothetical protein
MTRQEAPCRASSAAMAPDWERAQMSHALDVLDDILGTIEQHA